MNDFGGEERADFTAEQQELLAAFLQQVTEAKTEFEFDYHIVGFVNAREKDQTREFLDSLLQQDWNRASRRQQIAGTIDLLIGVLLRVRDGTAVNLYWVALNSPFEILDSAKVIAWGRVDREPNVNWIRLRKRS